MMMMMMMMMITKALIVLTMCPILHVLCIDTDGDIDIDIGTDVNIDTDYPIAEKIIIMSWVWNRSLGLSPP